jgi:hypothetical protein
MLIIVMKNVKLTTLPFKKKLIIMKNESNS